jgi:hypothetical protein
LQALNVQQNSQLTQSGWHYLEQNVEWIFERLEALKKDSEVSKLTKFKAFQDLQKFVKSLGFSGHYLSTAARLGENALFYEASVEK